MLRPGRRDPSRWSCLRGPAAALMLWRACYATGSRALSVNPVLPVMTLAELIALAKSEAGKHSYAVDMSSGYQVAFGQLLRKRAAIDIIQVPYKSAPMMLQDTAAGVTPLVLASLGAGT